jgi:hypothetical protein
VQAELPNGGLSRMQGDHIDVHSFPFFAEEFGALGFCSLQLFLKKQSMNITEVVSESHDSKCRPEVTSTVSRHNWPISAHF